MNNDYKLTYDLLDELKKSYDDILEKLEFAEAKANENWDLALRSKAEMENIRRRYNPLAEGIIGLVERIIEEELSLSYVTEKELNILIELSGYKSNQTPKDKLLIECPVCNTNLRIPKITFPKKGNITCKCTAKLSVRIDKYKIVHVNIIEETEESIKILTVNDALAVLGLHEDATKKEIKNSYKNLISLYHPDKVSTLGSEIREAADKKSKLINSAYDFLSTQN